MLALALAVLASEPPATARYVMYVAGQPVAVVSYSVTHDAYTYTSAHFFRSSQRELTKHLTLRDRPEVWWLSSQRSDGCTTVTEELNTAPETVCIDARAGGGTIDGKAFRASYRGGQLVFLEIASVTFVASSVPLPARADPFATGFEVKGRVGELRMVPSAPGARAISNVRGAMVPGTSDEASCLELARAFTANTPGATVVTGVVVDEGRAWPHAWVQLKSGAMLDPTVGRNTLNPRKYLAFSNDAGALFLGLVSGERHLELRQ